MDSHEAATERAHEMHDAHNVFTSRPFAPVDLENLRLTDNLDTHYEMLPLARKKRSTESALSRPCCGSVRCQ
jgi:hypothetical protein